MMRSMFAPTTGKMYLPTSEGLETNKLQQHHPSQQRLLLAITRHEAT